MLFSVLHVKEKGASKFPKENACVQVVEEEEKTLFRFRLQIGQLANANDAKEKALLMAKYKNRRACLRQALLFHTIYYLLNYLIALYDVVVFAQDFVNLDDSCGPYFAQYNFDYT